MSLRPTFMGMETMRRAIQSAQKGLDITGNNLANVKTAGYTRQRADYVSINYGTANIRYKSATSLAGQGVGMSGVTQIRNPILDKAFRESTSSVTESGVKLSVLSSMEDIFSSVYTEGFNKTFGAVKDALMGYDNADDLSYASIFQGTIKNMVSSLHVYSNQLKKAEENLRLDMKGDVDDVNAILKEIASLNTQIKNGYIQSGDYSYENGEFMVNNTYGPLELKDTRNLLLDALSTHGNIDVTENKDGTIDVKFGGQQVVSKDNYNQLKVDLHPSGATQLVVTDCYGKVLEDADMSKIDSSLTTGSMRGYLDMLNGAGIYGNSVDMAKTGTETQLKEIGALLEQIRLVNSSTDMASTVKEAKRKEYEVQLQAYSDQIAVNSTTGVVTWGGAELTGGSGKDAWAASLHATTNYGNNGFDIQFKTPTGELTNIPASATAPVLGDVTAAINDMKTAFDLPANDPGKAAAIKAAADKLSAISPDFSVNMTTGETKLGGHTIVDGGGTAIMQTVSPPDANGKLSFKFVLLGATEVTTVSASPVGAGMTWGNSTVTGGNTLGKGSLATAVDGALKGEIYSDAKGIPYFKKVADALANTIAREMNRANSLSKDKTLFYDANGKVLERPLFETSDGSAEFTAENLKISSLWEKDPMLHTRPVVGVYDQNGNCTGVKNDPLDGNDKDALMKGAIQNLTNALTAKKLFWTIDGNVDENKKVGILVEDKNNPSNNATVDGFISFYNKDINELLAGEQSNYTVFEVANNSAANARDAMMGVSFDEEGTNMMEFQKWYNAAARVMTAMDEALDTIINNMGIVGR